MTMGACILFGYRAGEIIGQNVSRLMPAAIGVHHDGFLAAASRGAAHPPFRSLPFPSWPFRSLSVPFSPFQSLLVPFSPFRPFRSLPVPSGPFRSLPVHSPAEGARQGALGRVPEGLRLRKAEAPPRAPLPCACPYIFSPARCRRSSPPAQRAASSA